jgi:LPXTG-site transpeptidase (sortase) family protein
VARHARERRLLRSIVRIASVACVSGALVIAVWLGWFYLHAATGGAHLLAQARQRIAASTTRDGRCRAGRAASGGAVGELVIPGLSLVAPVVQGDGDAQLADAVGHVPTSVWPGGFGTAVLVGHDVTWFHDLSHLQRGQEIEYVSRCRAVTYAVQRSQVVTQGAPVANTPGSLALVTCWPLDALWFTGQRLLVLAHAVGGSVATPAVVVPTIPALPALAVPPELAGVDSLAANPTPLGTLTVGGKPSSTFDESPGPLADAAAAQDVYFAAVRAAEAGDGAEWSVIAPTVPIVAASPLIAASITGFPRALTTKLSIVDTELTGAVLGVQVALSGAHAGTYVLTVTEAVVAGTLRVTSWQMRLAS